MCECNTEYIDIMYHMTCLMDVYIYIHTHIYGMWMYMVCSLPGDVHIQGTVFSDPVSHGCAKEGFGDFFVSFLNQNGSVADKVHRLNVTYCALAVWLMWKLWPFFLYIYIYQYMHIYILFTTSSVCFFSSDSSLSWRIRVFKYPVSSHISLRKYSRTPL